MINSKVKMLIVAEPALIVGPAGEELIDVTQDCLNPDSSDCETLRRFAVRMCLRPHLGVLAWQELAFQPEQPRYVLTILEDFREIIEKDWGSVEFATQFAAYMGIKVSRELDPWQDSKEEPHTTEFESLAVSGTT